MPTASFRCAARRAGAGFVLAAALACSAFASGRYEAARDPAPRLNAKYVRERATGIPGVVK
jgi:hypothetical protein